MELKEELNKIINEVFPTENTPFYEQVAGFTDLLDKLKEDSLNEIREALELVLLHIKMKNTKSKEEQRFLDEVDQRIVSNLYTPGGCSR